ncbi:MAG: MtaA/CmuA family methyltransferase [candidate division WS1 bacterium]|jgi:[methyl-Co(III) methanol-specific corrinoid protein]:coenzyme M methyltransferase|nr:MtaA/CmuA family methyltransferase [candidate division WS1 bacterium]
MTPRERILNALEQPQQRQQQHGLRRPKAPQAVGNAVSIATVELMEATGCFFPEAHVCPEAMAGLAAAGHEILGYDTIAPVFSVQQEADAMGCEVNWGRIDLMPEVGVHPCRIAADIRLPANILRHPAIMVVLDALQILRDRYPDVCIVGKVFGPWTLAYHLFGVERFLMMTLDNPAEVRRILRMLMPLPELFARKQLEAGADVITLADHATGDLVAPAMYHDFLWPLHKELASAIAGPVILHICGDTLDRIAWISRSGLACFHFESKVPAAKARWAAGDRIALMGNINNPLTLLHGTPADVAVEVEEALAAGVEIIAPECAVPLTTPTENLIALAEAARG